MRRRPLAVALVVYGVVGIALVVVGAVVGLGLAARVERLAVSADDALLAAARTTRTAAEAFTSVDDSLDEAGASTETAASLAREASATLASLASAMELSIFGAQPLIALADDFTSSSEQADALADALDGVGTSLGDTRTDVAAIGVEMDRLAADLEAVRDTSEAGSAPPVRAFVGLLLAWLLMPAVGSILGGLLLWREPPATLVARGSVRAAEDPAQPEERAHVEDHADRQERP
jgi:hypothetical protein